MKKLIVFIVLLAAFFVVLGVGDKKNPLLSCDSVGRVCIVSKTDMKDFGGVETIASGDDFYNFCSLSDAKSYLNKIDEQAVQYYLTDFSVKQFCDMMKIDVVSQLETQGLKVYCGYTPYSTEGVLLDGKKVNVQFVAKENNLIAGFPLILTGY